METNEANIIKDLGKLMVRLADESILFEKHKNDIEILRKKYNTLLVRIEEESKYKRYYLTLLAHSSVDVCHQCEGKGGGYIDMGEAGTEAIECGICNGTGIVKKHEKNNQKSE